MKAITDPEGYGQKKIGQDFEQKIADRFFGGSIDAFRAEAQGRPTQGVASAGGGDDTEARAALERFPEFSALARYAAEHALAAITLERVDGYPREVARDAVMAALATAFDESTAPTRGLRVLHIAANARDFAKNPRRKLPKGARELLSLPKD